MEKKYTYPGGPTVVYDSVTNQVSEGLEGARVEWCEESWTVESVSHQPRKNTLTLVRRREALLEEVSFIAPISSERPKRAQTWPERVAQAEKQARNLPVVVSREEYDALEVKDPDRLYMIRES